MGSIKLGAGHMLANKAAVLFRWRMGEASFVAVSCHLAPHDQNWEQRNSQWHEIVEGIGSDVDYVVFMGDLNYRIAVPYEQCKEMIAEGRLAELLEKDQLSNTLRTDPVIGRFVEPPIRFNPTFKFNQDTDVYDTSPKKRIPSWTDRILVRTADPRVRIGLEDVVVFETDAVKRAMPGATVFTTDYNGPGEPSERNFPRQPHCVCYRLIKNTFSDHRPVTATYKFPVPVVVRRRQEELEEVTAAKYEELKALAVPRARATPRPGGFELANTAIVWVPWSAVGLPAGVTLAPSEGVLMVGESVVVDVVREDGAAEVASVDLEIRNGEALTVHFDETVR